MKCTHMSTIVWKTLEDFPHPSTHPRLCQKMAPVGSCPGNRRCNQRPARSGLANALSCPLFRDRSRSKMFQVTHG